MDYNHKRGLTTIAGKPGMPELLAVMGLLSLSLVVAGGLILAGSLVPVWRLMERLPPGPVRSSWYALVALILVFLIGYLGYGLAFWKSQASLLDLIVPVVFFFGACFVFLAANLSLRTTLDLLRITLLEREACTDPLTGVFNRRYLDIRLVEEIARARRHRLPLSILLLDIDHFKRINDSHGHQGGDQVLISLGQVVAGALRESDTLARYGGEEFLVITPHTPLSGAIDIAERVCKRIQSHGFSLSNDPRGIREIGVTASIGVASLDDRVDSKDKLVQTADENLYRAKREGRNRVVAGTPVAPGPAVPIAMP